MKKKIGLLDWELWEAMAKNLLKPGSLSSPTTLNKDATEDVVKAGLWPRLPLKKRGKQR